MLEILGNQIFLSTGIIKDLGDTFQQSSFNVLRSWTLITL